VTSTTVFRMTAGTPIPPIGSGEWESFISTANGLEYALEYPVSWPMSIPPTETGERVRYFAAPPLLPTAAMILVPFDVPAGSMLEPILPQVESAALGAGCTLLREEALRPPASPGLHRAYACPAEGGGSRVEAFYFSAPSRGYALFVRGSERDVDLSRPMYERVVNVFRPGALPPGASGGGSPGAPGGGSPGAPGGGSPGAPGGGSPGAPGQASMAPGSSAGPGGPVAGPGGPAAGPGGPAAGPGGPAAGPGGPAAGPGGAGAVASSAPAGGGQSEETLKSYLNLVRDRGQQPERVMKAMGLEPGQTIADIGAGSGYFTWFFSRAVGASGTVWATDVDPNAIRFLERRLRTEPPPFANIKVLEARTDDVMLPPASLDHAFLCEVHFFLSREPATAACLRSLYKAMKPGGKVAVLEARETDVFREQVTPDRIKAPFLAAGFHVLSEPDFLGREYFILFGK
jgi:predicted methyltransferase